MIKDVVVHNGLLRIATGTFVCMVGHSDRGEGTFNRRIWNDKSACGRTTSAFVFDPGPAVV
jgi:hypothetical protein